LIGCRLDALNIQSLPIPAGRIYDGFECAILDALGKLLEVPVHMLLGGRYRDRVECSYWTGHRTTADAARKAKEGQDKGFSTIKFKCDLGDPVADWCAAIRERCGPNFAVVLDPNRRWETVAQTLQRSAALHRIGNVSCLEDPLPRWNFREYGLLRQKCELPIAIHVSLPYLEMGQMPTDVLESIRAGGCDYFNFNGGPFAVKRLATVAQLADIPFWHGSEVDLGILEAAYVHVASACANCTLPSDIFGRLVREHDLLREPLKFDGRFVAVPTAPGLGVEIDDDALARYTISEYEVK
jgi:muconate cycloisomerase